MLNVAAQLNTLRWRMARRRAHMDQQMDGRRAHCLCCRDQPWPPYARSRRIAFHLGGIGHLDMKVRADRLRRCFKKPASVPLTLLGARSLSEAGVAGRRIWWLGGGLAGCPCSDCRSGRAPESDVHRGRASQLSPTPPPPPPRDPPIHREHQPRVARSCHYCANCRGSVGGGVVPPVRKHDHRTDLRGPGP